MIPSSYIVLDKSYLQGCRRQDLKEILKDNRLIVCAETFHEVISSPDDEMRCCIKKLLAFTNFVDLLDHNGTLLKYEIENMKPCLPLSAYFLPHRLNPNWNYKISKAQNETIDNFHEHWEVIGTKKFDDVVYSIIDNCGRIKPEDVGRDKNVVLAAYSQLRVSESLPLPNMLDENWAIYRRLQVELIAAYEYKCSFRNGQFDINKNRKAHNQIDFRILVAAALAGGVATRDKLIKRYFEIICPDGVLYWLKNGHNRQSRRSLSTAADF